MLEYLQKFNNLPSDVKQKISSGEAMAEIEKLEGEYGTSLSAFIIRIMVGDLYYKNIAANLIIENGLSPEKASALDKELQEKVFAGVIDFLSGKNKTPATSVKPEAAAPAVKPKFSLPAVKEEESLAVRRAPVSTALAPVKDFFEEDKKDITTQNFKVPAKEKSSVAGLEVIVEEIVRGANVNFASAELAARFKDILSTYLRGVRTKAEIREKLTQGMMKGGAGLEAAEADRVLSAAEKKLPAKENKTSPVPERVSARTTGTGTSFIFNEEEIKRALKAREESKQSSGAAKAPDFSARDAAYDLSALKNKKPESASAAPSVLVSNTPKAEASAAPVKPNLKIDLRKDEENQVPRPSATKAISPAAPLVVKAEEKNRMASVTGNKTKMDDIKTPPKIMSPIDELAYMDLVSFRRLDENPARRTAKILEKVELLEREGIEQKILGVKAWRGNPVNKTYLSMGQESIGGGKNVAEVIKERQEKGLNYLSQEEFDVIMDLNNQLRF